MEQTQLVPFHTSRASSRVCTSRVQCSLFVYLQHRPASRNVGWNSQPARVSRSSNIFTVLHGSLYDSRSAWDTGIWAWDVIHQEKVLVIPSIVALLGDNPMQSELSCHVGLMGKYFCRVCKVKGFDAGETPESTGGTSVNRAGDSTADESNDGFSGESDQGTGRPRTSKKKKETLDEMVKRTKRFLQVSITVQSRYSH